MSDFLEGVQDTPIESGSSNYLKLESGSTTLRLMGNPTQYYTVWGLQDGERQKHVSANQAEIESFATREDPVRLTWGLIVWNYAEGKLMAWELTQKTIINQIITLANAETSMLDRDFTIIKSGEKMQTKYQVVPAAPSALEPAVAEANFAANINKDGFITGDAIIEQ